MRLGTALVTASMMPLTVSAIVENGLPMTNTPMAMPPMMRNSNGCHRTARWPPSATKAADQRAGAQQQTENEIHDSLLREAESRCDSVAPSDRAQSLREAEIGGGRFAQASAVTGWADARAPPC